MRTYDQRSRQTSALGTEFESTRILKIDVWVPRKVVACPSPVPPSKVCHAARLGSSSLSEWLRYVLVSLTWRHIPLFWW